MLHNLEVFQITLSICSAHSAHWLSLAIAELVGGSSSNPLDWKRKTACKFATGTGAGPYD